MKRIYTNTDNREIRKLAQKYSIYFHDIVTVEIDDDHINIYYMQSYGSETVSCTMVIHDPGLFSHLNNHRYKDA